MAKKKATVKPSAAKKSRLRKASTKAVLKKTVKKAGVKKAAPKAPKKPTPTRSAKKKSDLQVSFPPEVVVPGVAASLSENAILPEIAFYYPNPYWHDPDWAINLILFFDGIGMLIPSYMEHASELDDYAIIAGLKEHNLFRVFLPETFIDAEAASRLEMAMMAIIESGALDSLSKDGTSFAELSMSRMGFHVAESAAQAVFEQLKKRNLAKESQDGVSIPLHQSVRYIILVLLAQILRHNGRKVGYELLPATDRPLLVSALTELLSQKQLPSAEHVISLDLQAVGVDLGSVPIDEVLSFREENREQYRTYMRQLRLTVHEFSKMDGDAQQIALEDRQDEITSLASDIRKAARKAWKKPATFCLSAAGAIWRAVKGDPIGASLAGSAALLSLGKPDSVDTGAYSYLFSARNRFM